MKKVICYCLVFFGLNCMAEEWQTFESDELVSIYYRDIAEDLTEFKALTSVQVSPSALFNLLEDIVNVPNWMHNVEQVMIIKDISPEEKIVHTKFTGFWPVSPREMVTYSEIRQEKKASRITMHIKDIQHPEVLSQDRILMTDVKAAWHVSKDNEGQSRIEYQGYARPNGSLPHFLYRQAALSALQVSFYRLRDEVIKSKYQIPHPAIPND